MPKDYSDVVSGEGDDILHDADIDDDLESTQPHVNSRAKNETNGKMTPPNENDSADQEEDDDEEDDEEFQVESIQEHRAGKGEVLYFIKWVGYPASENTWEPVENLLPHSRTILSAYHDKLGFDPKDKIKSIKKKSTTSLRKESSAAETPPPKRRKTEEDDGTWLPRGGDWTAAVDKVETIERDESGVLQVYIRFRNNRKTKVSMDMVKKHCPVPMLEFYEKHLKFKLENGDAH